jgi:hypothetical protein
MNDRQLMKTLTSLRIAETNLRSIVDAALEESVDCFDSRHVGFLAPLCNPAVA